MIIYIILDKNFITKISIRQSCPKTLKYGLILFKLRFMEKVRDLKYQCVVSNGLTTTTCFFTYWFLKRLATYLGFRSLYTSLISNELTMCFWIISCAVNGLNNILDIVNIYKTHIRL